MVILVDTNVIIDFLTTREPYFDASSKVITKCANGELTGYIAFHSIPNLWYILRKVPDDKRRKWLIDICEFLTVVGVNHDEVLRAIRMKDFKDFEDCLQDRCAKNIGANYIITRNAADFIPAGNEPSGHAGMSIWRLPRGSNTPQLCCAASLMPRSLLRGI